MNRLHVHYGDGKGKTTAAMGMILRAAGHGWRVLAAQWMKNGDSGELEALKRFLQADVLSAPPMAGFTFQMNEAQKREAARQQEAFALKIMEIIQETKPALVVLDELGMALAAGLVTEKTGRALTDAALNAGETVITGYDVPEWLRERADYLTLFKAQKHPYQAEGLPAREGIEW